MLCYVLHCVRAHDNRTEYSHTTPKTVAFSRKKQAASSGIQTNNTWFSRPSALTAKLPLAELPKGRASQPAELCLGMEIMLLPVSFLTDLLRETVACGSDGTVHLYEESCRHCSQTGLHTIVHCS